MTENHTEIVRTEVPGGFVDSAYVDGAKSGEEIEFSRDKKRLVRITPYINGKREGLQIEYSDTGGVETPFKNDQPHGIIKWYDRSSRLLREDPFVNGIREGKLRDYVVRGNEVFLLSETMYKNGEKDGISTEYAEDGKTVKLQTVYAKGQLITK